MKQRLDKSCWKGYEKRGTKVSSGSGTKTRVNNCVKKGTKRKELKIKK